MSRKRKTEEPSVTAHKYALIDPDEAPELYELLRDLIRQYHTEIVQAEIRLAWAYGWNPDADGRLVLGKCKKASELDHRLHGLDFVVILNAEAWVELTEEQRRALVDHELCHAAPALDAEGEHKEDDTGRRLYRVRKHDIEEFTAVVRRHGIYKADIATFAEAAMQAKRLPLFADQIDEVEATFAGGRRKVTLAKLGADAPLSVS